MGRWENSCSRLCYCGRRGAWRAAPRRASSPDPRPTREATGKAQVCTKWYTHTRGCGRCLYQYSFGEGRKSTGINSVFYILLVIFLKADFSFNCLVYTDKRPYVGWFTSSETYTRPVTACQQEQLYWNIYTANSFAEYEKQINNCKYQLLSGLRWAVGAIKPPQKMRVVAEWSH